MDAPADATRFDPRDVTRPEPELLTYYIIIAALTLVGFPVVFLVLYFKYRTLKYKFDDDGVSMSWGVLFRREIYLTYRRIQDIHVSRNFIQRRFNLATVAVQTASGSAGAEMSIEGVRDPEGLRDYLYALMRGAKDENGDETPAEPGSAGPRDEALALLEEIRDALRDLRDQREATMGGGS